MITEFIVNGFSDDLLESTPGLWAPYKVYFPCKHLNEIEINEEEPSGMIICECEQCHQTYEVRFRMIIELQYTLKD